MVPVSELFSGLLALLLGVACVLGIVGIGLFVLAKRKRQPSRRRTDGGRHSRLGLVLSIIIALVVAVPVFAVGFYLMHADNRSTRDGRTATVSTNDPSSDDVPGDAPADRTESICADSSDDLPAWVCNPETQQGDRRLVVIVGEQFVTTEEAEQNALQQAEQRLRADFDKRHPTGIAWSIPLDVVQSPVLLHNRFLRRIARTSGSTKFQVRQMILQLELSPQGRKLIYPVWRGRVVGHRLWSLSGGILLLTVIFAAVTAYFRIDAQTGGRVRLWLKLSTVTASVALAVAIVIGTTSPVLETIVIGRLG